MLDMLYNVCACTWASAVHAGLVYKHYGREVVARLAKLPADHPDVETVYLQVGALPRQQGLEALRGPLQLHGLGRLVIGARVWCWWARACMAWGTNAGEVASCHTAAAVLAACCSWLDARSPLAF